MTVGQEFVDRSDLPVDQVKERVGPEQDHNDFQQQQIQGVPLVYMVPFMPEDLSPFLAVEIDLFIPEESI